MLNISPLAILGGGLVALSLEGIIRLSYWSLLFRKTGAKNLQKFLKTVAINTHYQRVAWWLRPLAGAIGGAVSALSTQYDPALHGALAAAVMVIYTLISPHSYKLGRAEVTIGFLMQIAFGAGGGLAVKMIFSNYSLPLAAAPILALFFFLALQAAQPILLPRDPVQGRKQKLLSQWTRNQWGSLLARVVIIVILGGVLFSGALLLVNADFGSFTQWGYITMAFAIVLMLVAIDRGIRASLFSWGFPARYLYLSLVLPVIMLLVGGHTITTVIYLVQVIPSITPTGGAIKLLSLLTNALVPFLPAARLITLPEGRHIFMLGVSYWVGGSILMGLLPSMILRLPHSAKSK